MTSIKSGLYLRMNELGHGPNPLPLLNGSPASHAYSAQGLFNPSEFARSHPAIHTWPEEKFVMIADCSDMHDNTHNALKRYGSLNAYFKPVHENFAQAPRGFHHG
jgi:S-adenosylmethionine/arginine decarboxylase-like enzyme